jgi:voltage-dependent potassium channel beta subunit
MSEFSLGSWTTFGSGLSADAAREMLHVAYSEGVNHFDTAEVYADGAAEAALGVALRKLGWRRETYLITTKIMWGTGLGRPNTFGLNRKHIIEGCRASLKRLRLGHVDFLLCHRPDPETPLEETIAAIGHLLACGDVLYWGTSEWPTEMISAAIKAADASGVRRPVVEQSQYNLFVRRRVEYDLGPLFSQGIGVCGWSPLLYGMLAKRSIAESRSMQKDMAWLHKDALPESERCARLAIIKAFKEIAAGIGLSPAGTALCWCLGHEGIVSVISGASQVEQLRSNLEETALIKDRISFRREIETQLQARGWRYDNLANTFLPAS